MKTGPNKFKSKRGFEQTRKQAKAAANRTGSKNPNSKLNRERRGLGNRGN